MKEIIFIIRALIYITGWFLLIRYANNAVIDENICKTIYSCFAMYVWFNFGKWRESDD